MDLKPIAVVYVYHQIDLGDGVIAEPMTWNTGDTVDDAISQWKKAHPGIKPSRIDQVVIPRIW